MSGLRIGSLFSGYGGADLACEAAFNADVVWVSDIDPGACKILAHRYPTAPNLGDITKIDWSSVEPVEVLTAGYPCQPFSKAGARKGTDDKRHLWPYVRDAIRALRPRITILENVAGHRSLGFDRVLGDLAEDGMHVRWTSLRASDVGAPHGRERVFLAVTDADREGHGSPPLDHRVLGRVDRDDATETREWERPRSIVGDRTPQTWGRYGAAITRWERIVGRPAPAPVLDPEHENPAFAEWMMGLPAGWVTDVPDVSWDSQLRALGNGVVPQQAHAAITYMLSAQVVS